jgi:A/G-specific adenine glycosylase
MSAGTPRAGGAKRPSFGERVLAWFKRFGRKDLPWQHEPSPYRVWISEVMLQQTRVATVIPYYTAFMQRFPDVSDLAQAPVDEVLRLWSGLGYYARARHLHQAARLICERHGGQFPLQIEQAAALPGVGRSTAGAILALGAAQRHPILDGNVRRLLARHAAVPGWPGSAAASRVLWAHAEALTPHTRVADYTQAMMDLGALVCTRSRPACGECPVRIDCAAHGRGEVHRYPAPRPRRELPVRRVRMLLLCNEAGEVLLERRPPSGIWGGLWSLPECPEEAEPSTWCRERLGLELQHGIIWPVVRHTFSHFRLDITPMRGYVETVGGRVMDPSGSVWYNTSNPDTHGLPAPVIRMLARLHAEHKGDFDGSHRALRQAG